MKTLINVFIVFAISGCSTFTTYQTPFSVEDPSVKGTNLYIEGAMISSTRDRYWYSYRYSLEQGGYIIEEINDFPHFKVKGITTPVANKSANFQLWKEGQAYAKSLCSDFFRRIALAKAHRDHAKKQTNIVGGIATAAMGLASASPEIVGGTGLLASGAESAFDAYDSSYLVTPDLGLMEALVRTVQSEKSASVTMDSLEYVSEVISHLNDFVYPCTFSGMKALLDDSLNKKISDFGSHAPFAQ